MQAIFPVPSGSFAGMNRDQVMRLRAQLQIGLAEFALGKAPQQVAYGTGDGNKSVQFNRTSEASIRQMINELNGLLGEARPRTRQVWF